MAATNWGQRSWTDEEWEHEEADEGGGCCLLIVGLAILAFLAWLAY